MLEEEYGDGRDRGLAAGAGGEGSLVGTRDEEDGSLEGRREE